MKKVIILIGFVLFFIVNSIQALAYTSCTPTASCPTGFIDNGTVCDSTQKICYKQCYMWTCGNASTATWTQVASGQPLIGGQFNFSTWNSATYNPTDTSKCYKFSVAGPSPSGSCIQMAVNGTPPQTCDSEAIVGLLDSTEASNSNPWFQGVSSHSWSGPEYLGTTPNKAQFNYMLKLSRAHVYNGGSDATYTSDLGISSDFYCANNSAICDVLAIYQHNCTTGCYNRNTFLRVAQGLLVDVSASADQTLYNLNPCATQYVQAPTGNFYSTRAVNGCSGGFFVYSAPANVAKYDTSAKCDMINEAPNITGVKVLPETPNAGQNLICNYTYYDTENFTEQNSSYEWWKNNVNQNINSQILGYKNLTPNNVWFCKVSGSDGDKTSAFIQSSNNVTIVSTIQNLTFYVNGIEAWNQSGYYGTTKIINFDSQLRTALDTCTADAQGYCDVSLTFFSNATGLLNITNINVYHQATVSVVDTTLNLTTLRSDNTIRLFEFIIINTGNSKISNLSWRLNTGESLINSTQNVTLDKNERLISLIHYNYTTEGSFTAMANITYNNVTSNISLLVTVGNLIIDSLQQLSRIGKVITYEIKISNIRNETVNNVNWSINISGTNVFATTLFNLTSNETAYLFFEQNYTNLGEYQVKATVFNQNFTSAKILTTLLKELVVTGLKVLNASGTIRQFEFLINNTLNFSVSNINWTLDTGLTNISSTIGINLTTNETIYVFTDYNYTASGTYAVNATARKNESSQDSQNISVTI